MEIMANFYLTYFMKLIFKSDFANSKLRQIIGLLVIIGYWLTEVNVYLILLL